jgi:predicted acylesterase/phospholipase RssA
MQGDTPCLSWNPVVSRAKVDVSQGAFMAGLYAQGLTWEQMHRTVRSYATQMGSVRHLISDLTLPIISVFNGHGFDRVIRESFSDGPQHIEDLWLRWAQRLCGMIPDFYF